MLCVIKKECLVIAVSKSISSSHAVQLLLSTPDFPNVFLNRVGSSLQYPETSRFPWILLGFAGSLSLAVQAWSGITQLIHGGGMELGLAVGKVEDWHLPPWPERQTLNLFTCQTMQKKKDSMRFSKCILECYTLLAEFHPFCKQAVSLSTIKILQLQVTHAQIAHHYQGSLNQMEVSKYEYYVA